MTILTTTGVTVPTTASGVEGVNCAETLAIGDQTASTSQSTETVPTTTSVTEESCTTASASPSRSSTRGPRDAVSHTYPHIPAEQWPLHNYARHKYKDI
ncbi:hypothetical protein NP493_1654g01071 [Ridgeia piscesae]|uniref:Uncharacterized protein n=1 Tax=Ridgeia piscesae TaxID=27915 RepID=A0AAD9JVR8_RIDPI|nr:hypothetical protein NP493_1654g01071 [Ridgeia piscesae]